MRLMAGRFMCSSFKVLESNSARLVTISLPSGVESRPWQGRVKGNRVICPRLPLPYLTMMAPPFLYFHLAGPHLPLPFTPLKGNSHFDGYNTLYLLITLYHTTY